MDWTPVTSWLLEHGIRILIIIALSVALYYLLHHFVPIIVRRTISGAMKEHPEEEIKKRAATLSAVFIDTGIVVIAVVAIFTIVAQIGINVAPALAGLGVAGIAIGFGAQSLVKDIFNGILILLENQFSVGDWISIAGVDGLVEQMNLRRTVVRDFDGTVHTVPNGEIKVATNFTKEWARVNMDISVGYGEDLEHVITVINSVGKELAEDPEWGCDILETPYALRVQAFEDSGIAIKIIGQVKQMRQWPIMGEMRLRLKKAFDQENIEIPWPHTKVFFGNVPTESRGKEPVAPKPPSAPPGKRKRPAESAPE